MKVFKSLSFLLGTFIFLFIPEPSYGKEINFICALQITNLADTFTFNSKRHLKIAKTLLTLYPDTKRFKYTDHLGRIFQGNAYYYKPLNSFISAGYVINTKTNLSQGFIFDRKLSYLMIGPASSKVIRFKPIIGGPCKVVPVPSSKKNLI